MKSLTDLLPSETVDRIMDDIEPGADGYYVYFPDTGAGGLPSWLLRQIADVMDDMNEPWHRKVIAFMDGLEDMPDDQLDLFECEEPSSTETSSDTK